MQKEPLPIFQLFFIFLGLLALAFLVGLSGCNQVDTLVVGGKPSTVGGIIVAIVALMIGLSLATIMIAYLIIVKVRKRKP